MIKFSSIIILLLGFAMHSCYSFKGIDIDPNTNTFYVHTFESTAGSAPATLPQTVSEALRTKIIRESRLTLNDTDPDIEFKGRVTGFRVSSVAPQRGELTAFNRLEIAYFVEYIDNKDEEKNWTKTYSLFSDFRSDQNLLDVQDQLIEIIHEELVEKIFNEAFTNW